MTDAVSPAPERHPHVRHRFGGETTFLLVRHGRTAANRQRLLQGQTDIPLDRLGERQAALIADRIAALPRPDALIASPLSRARVTAETIGAAIGMTPVLVPELVEISFGEFEGRSYVEAAAAHPEIITRLTDLTDGDAAWPGGETRREFSDRVMGAFDRLMDDYRLHRVVVVAHGGVLGAFLGNVLGLSQADPALYDIANCSLTEVTVSADHSVVGLRNDVAHLAPLVDLAEDWT